ncbi:hypothetical protein WISP_122544 [Willisornis vidua]|uniref:Uncharacterized protein n=1 Tax=Willisornis vidua TaxID=1566151 RepID=A0ABQ9CS01_9PASS|nr:hypothetical protein WISP_122544 [Willisornis vidua]
MESQEQLQLLGQEVPKLAQAGQEFLENGQVFLELLNVNLFSAEAEPWQRLNGRVQAGFGQKVEALGAWGSCSGLLSASQALQQPRITVQQPLDHRPAAPGSLSSSPWITVQQPLDPCPAAPGSPSSSPWMTVQQPLDPSPAAPGSQSSSPWIPVQLPVLAPSGAGPCRGLEFKCTFVAN